MVVKPEQLDHPERDLDLATRETRAGKPRPGSDADADLQDLRARIEAARTLQPRPEQRHCLDCFEKGRDAALRLIDGTDRP